MPADAPAGERVVRLKLRHQACNDMICLAPAMAELLATLRIKKN